MRAQNANWEVLKANDNYEISTEYPYPIRKISTGRVIHECERGSGYVAVHLNLKFYPKHRLIALQWIDNPDPDNLVEIDHINTIRSDNHISNLRWVTKSENNKNRASTKGITYEFLDGLPEGYVQITSYGKHSFTNLYYNNEDFIEFNDVRYRKLPILTDSLGYKYVNAKDINNKQTKVSLKTFYKKYNQ